MVNSDRKRPVTFNFCDNGHKLSLARLVQPRQREHHLQGRRSYEYVYDIFIHINHRHNHRDI